MQPEPKFLFGHVLQSLRKLLYQVKGFKASAVCFSHVKNSKQFLVLTKWVNKISFPGFLNLKDFFSMQYLIRSTYCSKTILYIHSRPKVLNLHWINLLECFPCCQIPRGSNKGQYIFQIKCVHFA